MPWGKVMQVHGACHCGEIEYEAELDPDRVVLCHCTDCQIMSGGPYRSIAQVPEGDFVLLKGEPKQYFKTGDSGNRRELTFCDTCGSHLYATSAEPPGGRMLGLRTGTLREGRDLGPKFQVWCQSKMPWAQDISALPGQDGQ